MQNDNRIRSAPEPTLATPPATAATSAATTTIAAAGKRKRQNGGSKLTATPDPIPGEAAAPPDAPASPAMVESIAPQLSSRGRARRERQGISTSIYFYDVENLRRLEGLCDSIPHCSVGKVMNQLLIVFLAAHDKLAKAKPGEPQSRDVVIQNVTVRL